jgi:hypothetical protein
MVNFRKYQEVMQIVTMELGEGGKKTKENKACKKLCQQLALLLS